MQTTKNYGLKKPEATDFYDVNDFNDNMDIIDEKLKDTGSSVSIDPTLSIEGAAADAKAVGDAIAIINMKYEPSTDTKYLKNQDGEWVSVGYGGLLEIVALIPAMTSNTSPSGVASSDDQLGNYDAYMAFSQSSSHTGWVGQSNTEGLTHYLMYEFPSVKTIRKILLTWGNTSTAAKTTSFFIDCYDHDKDEWVTVSSYIDITGQAKSGTTVTYTDYIAEFTPILSNKIRVRGTTFSAGSDQYSTFAFKVQAYGIDS